MVLWLLLIIFIAFPSIVGAGEKSGGSSGDIWDLLIKAVGAVIAAAVAYLQILSARPISRAALKTDLEILKLVDSADPYYETIRKSITRRIRLLYEEEAESLRNRLRRWAIGVFGLLGGVGFSYWTFYLVRDGFTWWAVLTGYLALAGLWGIVMSMRGTLFAGSVRA
jgi:hypothetical protein